MFTVELVDDVQKITVNHDSIDASNAKEIKFYVQEVIARMQAGQRLELDLRHVRFMDSSGLGSMVSILKACGKTTTLTLTEVNKKVMDLFELTRMNKIFSMRAVSS